jgi:plastocyanin
MPLLRIAGSRGKALAAPASAIVALLGAAFVAPVPAAAGTLGVAVRNADGEPVGDAVVYALPLDARGAPASIPQPVEIDQVDKEFVPSVSVVRVGTRVQFPNRDQIRHHVYSFSEAKSFEIPLYEGIPAEPILFDKPGPVVLGCNIHDWMRAYVFVVETPYFALTGADGRARVEVPEGEYSVRVWHPALEGDPDRQGQRASVSTEHASELRFAIEQGRIWRPRRSPSLGGSGYR